MMSTRVGIIVLTFNNFDDTAECLESVLRSPYEPKEVLLVDNHSTDGSAERLRERFPGIDHLRNGTNLGVAGGRNAGWNWVKAHRTVDVLLFLDNDTVLEPDAIGRLVGYLESHPQAAILAAKAYTTPPSRTIMSAGMYVNLYSGSIGDIGSGETDSGQYDNSGPVAACGGFCFLVRRAVFEACGGLDEGYSPYGWEDVDLCLRIRQQGYECHYVSGAVVYHKGCKIGRGYVPHYEKYKTRHYFRLLGKHTHLLQKACWSGAIALRGSLALARLLSQGEVRVAAAQLSGAFGALMRRRER